MDAAGQDTTTLLHALTPQKPFIPCNTTATKNATTNKKWPELGGRITLWNEFTLRNLLEGYGHVLNTPIPKDSLGAPTPGQALDGIAIDGELDVKRLIAWNDRLMRSTLGFAKSLLNLHAGNPLRFTYSDPDKSSLAKIPVAPRHLVDHVISLDTPLRDTLVVGLGRASSKFLGCRVAAATTAKVADEWIWPMRQLANLCAAANTRYGYIQTDEELVACCFEKKGTELQVAIMPVQWSSTTGALTTDLALWWLCMLAMADDHGIKEEGTTTKINAWGPPAWRVGRGWFHRHCYSKLERDTPPPVDAIDFDFGTFDLSPTV